MYFSMYKLIIVLEILLTFKEQIIFVGVIWSGVMGKMVDAADEVNCLNLQSSLSVHTV